MIDSRFLSCNVSQLHQYIQTFDRVSYWISILRVSLAIIGGIGIALSVWQQHMVLAWGCFGVVVGLFGGCLWWHACVRYRLDQLREMGAIDYERTARIEGDWTQFDDTGVEFLNKKQDHPYALDLNIVGDGSLYQFMCSAVTYKGRERLAQALLHHCKDRSVILGRQQAIQYLIQDKAWGVGYQVVGRLQKMMHQSPELLFAGIAKIKQKGGLLTGRWGVFFALCRWWPGMVGMTVIGCHFFQWSLLWAIGAIGVQLCCMLMGMIQVRDVQLALERVSRYLGGYSKVFDYVQQVPCKQGYLVALQRRLGVKKNGAAYHSRCVARMVGAMECRFSTVLHWALNVLFLWDLQWWLSILYWGKHVGGQGEDWLDVLAEIDVLISCVNLQDSGGDWCIPKLLNESGLLQHASCGVSFSKIKKKDDGVDLEQPLLHATDLGHPLIPYKKRVPCNLHLQQPMSMVTGSNMSGKSTFLRAIGMNVVLANMGAWVCASTFSCSIMDVYCSLHIQDSVVQGRSSFLTELQRIRGMYHALGQGGKVLCLIDELFKGTNAQDQVEAGLKVLDTLQQKGALTVVSTHNLDLCTRVESMGDLQVPDKDASVQQLHFKDTIDSGDLVFTYRLHSGVVPQRQVSALVERELYSKG
jgi:hypothetical protein